ncbi:hypothetical protein EDB85DRAFT_2141936 [Lactarius pseudohatsudake]|nr:hypothetical protein EDB85DRAFT_2141936 [Lactarius pseudohatsudake]
MAPRLSPRPTRKIQPTAKLSADNAALRHEQSGWIVKPTPSLPVSGSVSTPTPTPTDLDVRSSDLSPDPVSARTTKQSCAQPLSRNPPVIGDDGNTTGDVPESPDDALAAKKLKTTSGQGIGLQADISIILIDDVDNLATERLNKTDPTADLKEFFSAMPHVPGQEKGRMLDSDHNLDLNSSLVEFLIEFKTTLDQDPFVVNPPPIRPENKGSTIENPILSTTNSGRHVVGQIVAYATLVLSAQYRTHTFLVLVFKHSARLI